MAILDRSKTTCRTRCAPVKKQRVGALRLVLSELQKAAKEGSDDELAVLRRERKRRLEAARAYREAGREDLADGEESEARADRRLPAGRALRRGAAGDRRAGRARERGGVGSRTWVARWAARWRRWTVARTAGACRAGQGGARRMSPRRCVRAAAERRMRTQIELPNDVAAELAGSQDAVLRALEAHLRVPGVPAWQPDHVRRRAGRDARRRAGRARALRSDPARPSDRAGHDRGGDGRAGRARVAGARAGGCGVAPSRPPGGAEDGQPEALRRLDPRRARHVRDRAGRHGQDVSRGGDGGRGAVRGTRSTASS